MFNSWLAKLAAQWLILTTLASWSVNCHWTSDPEPGTYAVYVRTVDRFDQPVDDFLANEPVRFVVTVDNTGNTPVELEFMTTQRFEFSVYDQNGRLYWRWSDATHPAFIGQYYRKTLGAGEQWEFSVVWDQTDTTGNTLPSGLYRVDGTIIGAGSNQRNFVLR